LVAALGKAFLVAMPAMAEEAPRMLRVEIAQQGGHFRGRGPAFPAEMDPRLAAHLTHEEFKDLADVCSKKIQNNWARSKVVCIVSLVVVIVVIVFVITMSALHVLPHSVCVAPDGDCPVLEPNTTGDTSSESCCTWWCCQTGFVEKGDSTFASTCTRIQPQPRLEQMDTCNCRDWGERRICDFVHLEGEQAYVEEQNQWARSALTTVIVFIALYFLGDVLFSIFSTLNLHHQVDEKLDAWRKKGLHCEYFGAGTRLRSCFNKDVPRSACIAVHVPVTEVGSGEERSAPDLLETRPAGAEGGGHV
jgi:hypothetical protein